MAPLAGDSKLLVHIGNSRYAKIIHGARHAKKITMTIIRRKLRTWYHQYRGSAGISKVLAVRIVIGHGYKIAAQTLHHSRILFQGISAVAMNAMRVKISLQPARCLVGKLDFYRDRTTLSGNLVGVMENSPIPGANRPG